MSFAGGVTTPKFTVAELKALNKTQLVQFLQSRHSHGNVFEINDVEGLRGLSTSERVELGEHMKDAFEIAASTRKLDVDELVARLRSIADGQDGSTGPRCLQSPSASSGSSTSSINSVELLEQEGTARYNELIRNLGRPVASIETFLHFLIDPAASDEPFLPWCSDTTPYGRRSRINNVFSLQLDRWWEFRKWQLANRDTPDADGGFPEYLASSRRIDEHVGNRKRLAEESYDDDELWLWQGMRERRLLPSEQGFTAYKEAVKRQLAPHNFKRSLQLFKDPRRQTEWTTWLEYLVYEQWCLEQQNASVESARTQYIHCHEKLVDAGNYLYGYHTSRLDEQLATMKPDLEMAKKILSDYIRDTDDYRCKEERAHDLKNRVKWIISEARKMKTDMLQKGSTAGRKSNIRKSKDPSHLADDDGITPQPWSERTRQGVAKAKRRADQDSMPEQPRRSHRKLTQGPSATQGVESSAREKQG
ncbi:hypothetical protein BU24DRAFT_463053 [Aaosphaeria arxii CBS 175.79]|uniref:Uncharacterized protein n=1 Tax=Aaosphaeria arxii CBS 175.79 TaxID=1450172 RepID=A0A6A5XN21_9PLEO|nr:uncharacterized protein BU24DRAFT_463053 [Aaosphaeria arxii CBS 175.79]KAF2014247.1 hypothetical protein BU24DRAFT_463053 [Aaosphaeria arxii CBS 175.79]